MALLPRSTIAVHHSDRGAALLEYDCLHPRAPRAAVVERRRRCRSGRTAPQLTTPTHSCIHMALTPSLPPPPPPAAAAAAAGLMTRDCSFDRAHMPKLPEGLEWAYVYAVNDYGIKPDSDADPQVRLALPATCVSGSRTRFI
jgi:hypothetical protein